MKKWIITGLCLFLGGTASAQSMLEEKQQAVRQNHPELKAIEAEKQAVSHLAEQKKVQAPLMIEAGAFILPVETRLGPQRLRLGLSQQFNLNRERSLLAEAENKKSEVQTARYEATRLRLEEKMAGLVLELAATRERIRITRGFLPLLQQMESLATQRVESGTGNLSEVLRVQKEIAALRWKLGEMERKEKEQTALADLEQYGDRKPGSIYPDSLGTFPRPSEKISDWFPEPSGAHPEVEVFSRQLEQLEAQAKAAEKMGGAKLGIGLNYITVDRRTDMDPVGNGRDILMPMLSFMIPLHRKPYQAKREELNWRVRVVEEEKQAAEWRIEQEVVRLLTRFEDAKEKQGFLKSQIELTRRILDLQTTEYMTGKTRFEELLKTQRELLALELEEVDTRLQQFRISYSRYNVSFEN